MFDKEEDTHCAECDGEIDAGDGVECDGCGCTYCKSCYPNHDCEEED